MKRTGWSWRQWAGTAVFAAMAIRPAWGSIVVAPLKQDVTVQAGKTAKCYITIYNKIRDKTTDSESVRLEVQDFLVAEDGSLTFRSAGTTPQSAGGWVTLDQTALTLAPGEFKRVECRIAPPPGASGERYACVMVTIARKQKQDRGVVIGHRFAAGLFITVAGQAHSPKAELAALRVCWPTPTIEPVSATQPECIEPVKVAALLKNTGRVRFDASGQMRLTDLEGHVLYKSALSSRRPTVLVGDARQFEANLDIALPPGDYMLRVDMDYQSKYGRARMQQPLTISPEQADSLALRAGRAWRDAQPTAGVGAFKISPEKLAVTVEPGAGRWVKLSLNNVTQDDLLCNAYLAADSQTSIPPSWLTIAPSPFSVAKGKPKTVSVFVDAQSAVEGAYAGRLVVDATTPRGTTERTSIPLHVEIVPEQEK